MYLHTHDLNPDLDCYACLALEEAIEAGAFGSTMRRSFPNPDRPVRWPEEEDHFRTPLGPGDIVRTPARELARIIAWCNAGSHAHSGRLAYLRPLVTYPGETITDAEQRRPLGPGVQSICWEVHLEQARPGDVGRHLFIPPGKPITVQTARHLPCNWL
jgi:hypothetical protein